MRYLWALSFATAVCFPGCAISQPAVSGIVLAVSDGRTLSIRIADKPVEVRLFGLLVPKLGEPFGALSRKTLADLCLGIPAEIVPVATNAQDRIVGEVVCAGRPANRLQLLQGLAWVDRDIVAPGSSLFEAEADARTDKRQIWSGRGRPPAPSAP